MTIRGETEGKTQTEQAHEHKETYDIVDSFGIKNRMGHDAPNNRRVEQKTGGHASSDPR